MKKNMSREEIERFNGQVDYNNTVFSWIVDIISTLIAWPMILLHIHRRRKYSKKIDNN